VPCRAAYGRRSMYGVVAHPFYNDIATLVRGDGAAGTSGTSGTSGRGAGPLIWDVEDFPPGTFTRTLGDNLAKRKYAVAVCAHGIGDSVLCPPIGNTTTPPTICMLVYWGPDMFAAGAAAAASAT